MPEVYKVYSAKIVSITQRNGSPYQMNWRNRFVEKNGKVFFYRSQNLFPGRIFACFFTDTRERLNIPCGDYANLDDQLARLTTNNSIYVFRLFEQYRHVLVENSIRCKHCGDLLTSKSRHDLQTCSCGCCSIDGGHDYTIRSYRNTPEEDYWELSAYRLEKME